MKIAYVAAGVALAGCAACYPLSARPSAQPAPVAPATVYVTPAAAPTTAPPVSAFVQVPDLAFRRLDVAEFLLDGQGLGHSVIGGGGPGVLAPSNWQVCSSLPRAGTTVRSGTRVALIVEKYECDAAENRPTQ